MLSEYYKPNQLLCFGFLTCNFCLSYCHYTVSRHRTLMNLFDKVPNVHKDAFVAPSASVIGDVQVGQGSSIWYGCVLRGMLC